MAKNSEKKGQTTTPEGVEQKNRNGFNDINDVTLKGRLSQDPKIRITGKGSSICHITVAVNTGRGDYARADFIPVRIIGKQADIVADNLNKGDSVIVKGSLSVDNWQKDGEYKSATYILAQKVIFSRPIKSVA